MSRIETIPSGTGFNYAVTEPFEIGPRSIPSLRFEDGSRLSIHVLGRTPTENRWQYEYAIDGANGERLHSAADLASPVDGEPDVEQAFQTLTEYIGTAAEAQRHTGKETDKDELFPGPVMEWCSKHSDELYRMVGDIPTQQAQRG